MRIAPFGIAALSLSVLLLTAASLYAQSPPPGPSPVPGFMPPYEVTRVVRSAGFDPLAPPLRERTTYVFRATDFRGILMRVVVDAHSGAIRAVNRIVPGPSYGDVGMATPPYATPSPYGVPPPPYAMPPPEADAYVEPDEDLAPPPMPAAYPAPHAAVSVPLPRPRPAELAAREAKREARPAIKPAETSAAKAETKSETKPETKTETKTDIKPGPTVTTITTPPPASAPPRKPAPSSIPD